MSDIGMLMEAEDTSRDCEIGGAKTSTKPRGHACRHASSTRWGLRRVLVAASAVAVLASVACLLLRPAGPIANADEEPLQVADVPATETLAASACAQYPYLKFEKVLHSNLGGHGPDRGEEGIIYVTRMLGAAAGKMLGEEVELVLHAVSAYHPAAPGANGMQGEYGSVNILHGTSVDIMFSVRHHTTKQPMTLPHMAMTFFDLDQGPGGHCRESVTVGGFSKIIVTPNTEVHQVKRLDGRTAFLASTFGTGDDNPKNPMFLTDQQKNRAVSLVFENFHMHKVTIGATAGATPRFFTFIGRPSLLCAATVQQGGYVPPKPTLPPKYPKLHYGPLGLQPIVVPPSRIFVMWFVDLHDHVKKGDPIAKTRHIQGSKAEMILQSPHDGTIVAKAPLKPGDIIDQRMFDHNIATLDERLAPLKVDAPSGEEGEGAPRVRYFVEWLKEPGDPVTMGEPIAKVSSRNPLHNVGLGVVSLIKATETGFIKDREPMQPGDPIGEVQQNVLNGEAYIAVVAKNQGGTPWWVWLLLLLLAAAVAIAFWLFCLPKKKEEKKETYKPLPEEIPVVVPPPPPPPVQEKEPDGLRLDFDDHKGTIHTLYATMRPLGIICAEKTPIDVQELTFNSYAKTLGVKPGWTIVRVGASDVRQSSNYGQVAGLINDGLKIYPVFPLRMELIKAGTEEKKSFDFTHRPLGFEFDNKAPIRVKRVYPNSYAQSLNMRDYIKDYESWAVCKIAEVNLPPSDHDFPKILNMMKDGCKALDPFAEKDGTRSKDQLKGWDA